MKIIVVFAVRQIALTKIGSSGQVFDALEVNLANRFDCDYMKWLI